MRCMSLAQVTMESVFRYGDTTHKKRVSNRFLKLVGRLTVDHDGEETVVERLQAREATGYDLVEYL